MDGWKCIVYYSPPSATIHVFNVSQFLSVRPRSNSCFRYRTRKKLVYPIPISGNITSTNMKLRWGICGCGLISSDFVKAVSLLPSEEHEIVAAAASSYDRAKEFVRNLNLGHATAYGSYEKLYTSPEVDVVYIGLWNHQHKAAVISALRAGKHVVCEKPLGLNSAEVKEMVQVAREVKKFFMEGFWSRMLPSYQKIREEIRNGTIGEPKAIMGCFGYVATEKAPRVLHAKYGGGLLMDIGCYLVSLTLWVFGKEKPQRITAVGNLFPGKDVDNTAGITLHFSGGRVAHLLTSGSANLPNEAVISGSNGSRLQILDHIAGSVVVGTPHGRMEFPLPAGHEKITFRFPNTAGLAYEAECVRRCIANGMTECPDMPLDESILIAEIMEECRRQLGVQFPTDTFY